MEKLIGWFSRKQKEHFQADRFIGQQRAYPVIWLDVNGNEVECTEVRRENRGRPLFDDSVCLGEVVRFVRQVRR